MVLLNEMLQFNEQFVSDKKYEEFVTDKFPNKKVVILTCMDTRLVELLPKALNLRNGDVKMLKSAGAIVNHPFGSIMRSLLVAVYELNAQEVLIIGHHDCGMSALQPAPILTKMKERGLTEETLNTVRASGIDVDRWLEGFENVEDSVRHSVQMVRQHPFMDKTVPVHGLVIDPKTGKLDLVDEGYKNR
ncbi:beta-class carbonic anhydrase [Planococcus lenghuensis]|uniref:carbonic anhydrase n=1 Tax=Planococcus lenghuensis TaxID=2213202 RepID=A0A1Q2KWA7_9BACL|nr:carbonic anhydrase [Planococcus lenghuensis]AQQ52480.1 carbonic anhydrase [Planococcus lenghuensis]